MFEAKSYELSAQTTKDEVFSVDVPKYIGSWK